MSGKEVTGTDTLVGWKQIANYLGKGVRTVQRYERALGLPVHRPAGKSAAAVFANKSELDNWIMTGPARQKHLLSLRANKAGADFLLVDSEIALTFAGLALQTADDEKRRRRIQVARKAYDTIRRMREGIELSKTESAKLDSNVHRLKSDLQRLGESL